MLNIDKRILNFLVIIALTFFTFFWTSFIFKMSFHWEALVTILVVRILASAFIFRDYSLSWSKVSQKTFLIKSFVYIVAFLVYAPF